METKGKKSFCITSWKDFIRAYLEVKEACINIRKIDAVANFEFSTTFGLIKYSLYISSRFFWWYTT